MRRWLLGTLLAALCWLPAGARAVDVRRPPPEPAPEQHAARPAGPPAAVAILFTIVVVVLVCLPNRKASRRPPR
jgi:hypothetical protein